MGVGEGEGADGGPSASFRFDMVGYYCVLLAFCGRLDELRGGWDSWRSP